MEEGEEILEEFRDSPALDAGLVAAAQAVEHYEMARYGTLKRWAQVLGMNDAAKLLDQNLAEEKYGYCWVTLALFLISLSGQALK